ncbi:hypothetical protein [Dethiobacter alkaliphilus]|uniref:hypothetical protein n=1 Tax=Dethiobacter alkaliphilus TaxID=427926 RepID=UPI002225D984|nr:hypothetical protein [Dethiobacter alkaliphilus]MCW3490384.1 hypothetical protein [Dethiobacter alkaliphilus]
MVDEMILLGFVVILILYLNDLKNLIIPAKKKSTDMIIVTFGLLLILGVTFLYGQTWFHYTLGVLGAITFVLSVFTRGVTAKGFLFAVEPGIFGYWGLVENVKVEMSEEVCVTINRRYGMRKEVHYYEKEDYDKVSSLLSEYLPREKVKVG